MRFLRKIYNDSLIKNVFYLMITNLLNLILGFFFWIIVARYYSPDAYKMKNLKAFVLDSTISKVK